MSLASSLKPPPFENGCDGQVGLTAGQLDQVFPFHLVCDERMRVVQCGSSLVRVLPGLQLHQPLEDTLRILRPSHITGFEAARRKLGHAFLLESREGLRLRGQALLVDSPPQLLFLITPWFAEPNEAKRFGITIQDLPIHDAAREYSYILRMQREAVEQSARAYQELELRKRDIEQMRDAALAASRSKSEFLAMMSHEIRTPLNGVVGMLDYLLGTEMEGETRECVHTAHGSALGLMGILNDILDLSKLEAGRLELDPAPFSLASAVESIRAMFAWQALERGIDLRMELDDACPLRLGDAARIRQVLANLVSNALKFTKGGMVRIRQTADGDMVTLEVIDNGVGIPPDQVERLFRPFHQIGKQSAGTGLGLSICRRLAELMGGSISFTSNADRGACFRLQVPLPPADPALTPSLPEPAQPVAGRQAASMQGLALVVEDNLVNQRIASLMLSRLGYTVECAENGAEGVDLADEKAYDVIFMDMQMPVMTGLEAARQIRSGSGPNHATPIVALTANAFSSDREECLAAGMDYFLAKPLQSGCLRRALREVRGLGDE